MGTVKITGWTVGAKTISAIAEVRDAAGLGLAESKRLIEEVFDGATVVLPIADERQAERCASALRDCGFVVESA